MENGKERTVHACPRAGEESRWRVRAAMCELLALGFRYPSDLLVESAVSGEYAEAAEELASLLLGERAPDNLRELLALAGGSDEVFDRLRPAYTKLFIGAPQAQIEPYEGVWDAVRAGTKALLYISPKAMAVEQFCKTCGIGRPDGTNEPLDHVAAELELLEYLAAAEAGVALLPEGFSLASFPGGSPGAAYAQFFSQHFKNWAGDFADVVRSESVEPFYRSLAALLHAFILVESEVAERMSSNEHEGPDAFPSR